VSARLIDRAPAKVNLTLRVLRRRADGYHELESLVAFADFSDTLTFTPGGAAELELRGAGAQACGPAADNLVLKAAVALGAKVAGLKLGRFVLDKQIPVAAGLGGGSADAAAALRLLARANALGAGDSRLFATACDLGADVPVCLDPKTRIVRGIGELLSESLDLPKLPALLVNPGVALATRDVFAAFDLAHANGKPLGEIPRQHDALVAHLVGSANDLERAAIALRPVIAEVLGALRALPGCRLARMSGSGPSCFALFRSPPEAEAAGKIVRSKRKDWWVHCGAIG
jgi:4-diphosphocytidyl-2-C-methyl-D-erythritol kinase